MFMFPNAFATSAAHNRAAKLCAYLKYDLEKIIEMYYGLQLMNHLALSFDLQNVTHPAYNILRGPVTIYAVRLHADF